MNDYLSQLAATLRSLPADRLSHLRTLILKTAMRGGTVWVCGNGGSAAVASHWACDLQKAAGIRAVALGTNAALSTAWSNDDSYAAALAAELRTLARGGDCLVALSCSGTSPNVTTALRQAWLMRMPRVLLTQAETVQPTPIDVLVEVASSDYGILEDCFAAIGHALTQEIRAERIGLEQEIAA